MPLPRMSNKNKRLQVTFTHARVHTGASVYSPGPEEDWFG